MNDAAKASLATKAGFLFICLSCIVFILLQVGQPLRINTNLKDLSPQLTEDKAPQRAVVALSGAIENRFTLLLVGPDRFDTEAAAQILADGLSVVNGVTAVAGEAAVASNILDQLARHRFGLLTDTQRQNLATRSTDGLVATATERLYQLAGAIRLLPVDQDPFGWFTDYILEQTKFSAAQEPAEAQAFTAVRVTLDSGGLETNVQDILQEIMLGLEGQVAQSFPTVEVLHSGVFFFAADAARSARKDIKTISSVSVIAIVCLLLLTFYSLRPLLLPFVSVLVGIGFAFVVTYSMFGSIHVLTIVFGASLIGIIIDYSLHYFYCHSDQASDSTHSGLMRAMKLSLVSSLIGYGALGLSDLVSLQRIAVFSCTGLLAAWVTVLATAKLLMGKRITINPNFLPPIVEFVSGLASRIALWPKAICGAIALVLVLLAVTGTNSNDTPRAFFNPSEKLLQQEQRVAALSTKIEPGRYFIVRAEDEETLYARLQSLLQLVPEDTLVSVASWLPSPQAQHKNYQDLKSLYQPGGAIEEFMTGLGLDASNLQKEFRGSEGVTLSAARLFSDTTSALPPLVIDDNGMLFAFVLITDPQHIQPQQFAAWNLEGVNYIDIAAMSTRALKDQRKTSTVLLIIACLLVAITLWIRYRQWSKLLMLLIPVTSILSTFLLFSLSGTNVNLFHSMAMFLVLGLGMDYVIFVSELQNVRRITEQAVFLSAMTSLLAFGLLSLSSIPVVHAFGITVLIGNGLNLIGSLIYSAMLQHNNRIAATQQK